MLERALIGVVRLYQLAISPWFPGTCRFTPTCSAYSIEALRRHGAAKGLWLTVRRLVRCQPWGGVGYDPVPPATASKTVPDELETGPVAPVSPVDTSHENPTATRTTGTPPTDRVMAG